MLKIFVGNLTEGSATYLRGIKNEEIRQKLIQEDQGLSDRFLYSCEDNTILITPWKINEEFKNDAENILNLKNVENWSPEVNTISLSRDIEDDKILFKQLIDKIREANSRNEEVTITAYSNTPEFLGLMLELQDRNCRFTAPDAPVREFYWTISFLDSKGGFRQIVQMVAGWERALKMPWGVICAKPTEARKIGQILFHQNKGFVVKTNWGQAGEGLIIVRRDNGFKTYEEASQFLKTEFEKDDYWDRYPIIVEEFIPPDLNVGGGAPNVECYVDQNGEPRVNYTCGMRMTKQGNFQGIEIGKNALPDEVEKTIRKVGKTVGKTFASFGFRGFYEVDLQAGLDGELYCLESNIRRTGGTHVYDTARRLFGKDFFEKKYLVSHNNFIDERIGKLTYQTLKEKLKKVWYGAEGKEVGFMPTIVSSMKQNVLGYIIVGDNHDEAIKMEEEFKKLL
jgi:hypothetical protein